MNPEGRLRIGIIGAGFWGRNHARVLSEITESEIIAICDVNEKLALEIAKRYNIKQHFTDYQKLLKSEEIDAVTICTPSITHAEICIQALKSGKDVLVEKPMASNLSECVAILDAVKSSKRRLMVGFIERFNPAVEVAKQEIEAGVIGRVLLIYGRRIGPWPERIGDVGVVKDTSIHDIDLSLHFLGERPESVYAVGGSILHRFEDHLQALISFRDGKSAVLEANWLTPRKKRDLRITGTEGVMYLEFLNQELTIEKSNGVFIPANESVEPLKNELRYFVSSLLNNRRPEPNEVDGTWALLLAEAALISMRTHKIISVDDLIKEQGLENRI